MKRFGIDISTWQPNYPYSAATKEGVEFAIIRAGYAEKKDDQFENHYKAAKEQGWDVGAYWYSYATTVAEAKKEAQAFLKAIAGKKFELPVYMDVEDPSMKGLGKTKLNAIITAFAEVMENAGYYFGVYTNVDWYRNYISGSELNKKYDWWVAQWASTEPTGIDYGVWQFGGSTNYIRSAKIGGVTTDQNYCVKDYPSIIKNGGFNGYGKNEPEEPAKEPEEKPAEKPTTGTVKLSNEPLYASSTAKTAASKITGTYYYWDNETVNGRRRITNAKSRVGVEGQVTGWIAVSTASKPSTPALSKGAAVKLTNCPLYASSTTGKSAGKVTGTYYLWDGKLMNGRYRITNAKNRVGVAEQVTGWINAEDI